MARSSSKVPAAGPVTTSRIHPRLSAVINGVEPGRIVRVAEHDGYVVDLLVRNTAAPATGKATGAAKRKR